MFPIVCSLFLLFLLPFFCGGSGKKTSGDSKKSDVASKQSSASQKESRVSEKKTDRSLNMDETQRTESKKSGETEKDGKSTKENKKSGSSKTDETQESHKEKINARSYHPQAKRVNGRKRYYEKMAQRGVKMGFTVEDYCKIAERSKQVENSDTTQPDQIDLD